MTGLISLITQARSPATLRKSTVVVIESIYARDGAPPEITAFGNELERMLPDDLPEAALPKIADAVTEVLREIKVERIRQQNDAADMDDLVDDFDDFGEDDEPKKKRKKKGGWFSRKKKPKKTRKPAQKSASKSKKGKSRSSIHLMIFGGLALLLLIAGGGGGTYYLFFMDHGLKPGERAMKLIQEMEAAAEGTGPARHEFGWDLIVETRAGLTGVTAIGVPADACASAAWYFVNRGNVLINDRMPEKIAPSLLKQFCSEKGQRAKLMWLSEARPGMADGATSTDETDPETGTESLNQLSGN